MAYTISTLKDDVIALMHNTSINKIQNFNGVVNRAGKELMTDLDPMETVRIAQIQNAIYDKVYDYVLPTDVKGNKIIDIRPQVNRQTNDSFFQEYSKEFDQYKSNNKFEVRYNSGVKTLRLSKNVKPGIMLNDCNGISTNGAWAVGNDAENLSQDKLYKISGSASLKFDLDGSTTDGYLENSTMDSKDLSDYENIGAIFMWVYIPDTSIMTSIDLRWGNDSSNYWNSTETTGSNSDFETGWNLIRFDWNGATETGSPDSSAIDYLRATINYDGTTDTDLRIDNIMSKLGDIYELEYYSKYLFKDSSGNWIESITDDSDIVNLDVDSYNILTYKCAEISASQMQGESSSFDLSVYSDKYSSAVSKYKRTYKSQVQKPIETYYSI